MTEPFGQRGIADYTGSGPRPAAKPFGRLGVRASANVVPAEDSIEPHIAAQWTGGVVGFVQRLRSGDIKLSAAPAEPISTLVFNIRRRLGL